MMIYILICLSLTLTAVAVLQLLYMIFLKRLDREHKKGFVELERKNRYLEFRLTDTERELASRDRLVEFVDDENEEVWADVIDER